MFFQLAKRWYLAGIWQASFRISCSWLVLGEGGKRKNGLMKTSLNHLALCSFAVANSFKKPLGLKSPSCDGFLQRSLKI